MSIQADNNSLNGRIRLDEEESKTIENPPDDIVEQLKSVEFERKSANVFVKKRRPYTDSSTKKVVEVRLKEDSLTLSSESIVGVVNLTPTSKIQIDPKVGWADILEMFLTVQEQNRSIEYQGVPIREFLGDDLAIEDIFVVIAVNYLNSLEPIWRHGLVRTFETREHDSLSGRGKLDIQQSLLNRTHPTKGHLQRFVEKKVDYDLSVHGLLHRAGKELLKLFKTHSGEYDHDGYYRIFENVEEQVRRLEENGVTSKTTEHSQYSDVSIYDLPPTRHYYENAIRTSKMILSSSTGKPMATAEQDLTMDYILNMNDLFEKYTQAVLEQEIEAIKKQHNYSGPESLEVSANKSIQIFQDKSSLNYQPDHIIHTGDDIVAILDSKYYSDDKNPVYDNYARSRLFSYAYFWETDELAFIVPSGGITEHSLTGKDGKLTIVGPEGFDIDEYSKTISSYLMGILAEFIQPNPVDVDLEQHSLPVPSINVESLSEALADDRLQPQNVQKKSTRIIRHIANDLPSDISHSRNTHWREISAKFSRKFEHHDGNDRAIPIFRPADSNQPDNIRIYFIPDTDADTIEFVLCGPYKIDWYRNEDGPLVKIDPDDSSSEKKE